MRLTASKNLEVYLTAGIALAVSVLGLLNVVDTDIVAAATLGTLALVALSSLNSRHQVTELQSNVDRLARLVTAANQTTPSADRLLAISRSGVDIDLGAASDIRLIGVTLSRTIRNQAGEMQRRLADGATVRVAMIDPESTVPQEAARRSTIPHDAHMFRNRVTSALDLLRELAATPGAKGRLEVRLLPFVPAFGLTMIDPTGGNGRIHVDIYSHRSLGPDPVITLGIDTDPHWYRHFLAEFDRMWQNARPLDLDAGRPD